MKKQSITLYARISEEEEKKLKKICINEGVTMTHIVTALIRKFIKKKEEKDE